VKKLADKKGYILLNVMVLLLLLFTVMSCIFAFVTWEHRMVVRQLERTQNFYTSVSAIRMIEVAILEEEEELVFTDQSYDKTWGTLQFSDDECVVQIPVAVWIECEEDEITIYAEAGREDVKESISLIMRYDDGWYSVKYTSFEEE